MKVNVIIADTGRPTGGGTLNLLNAGWAYTSGPPQPAQAVSVFVEVPWDQLNKAMPLVVELVDDEGHTVNFVTPEGEQPARIESQIMAGNVPGAPNGTPGPTVVFFEIGPGVLQLPAGHRYTWRVSIDGRHDELWEASFWVQQQILQPRIGGPFAGR